MSFSVLRARFAASSTNPTDQNIRNLYLEIAFASVLGAIVTFNAAYALRLGASNQLIALLSSMPALVAAIASIPTARFLQRRRKRKFWIFGSLLLLRLGHAVLVVLPWLFPPVSAATWLVVWVIALNLPSIFFTNGFFALLGELVPEQRRAFVFSRRSIIWSIGLVIVSALVGVWLDHVMFPLNYQLMYAFGVVTALMSNYFLSKLHVPDRDALPVPETEHPVEAAKLTGPIARMLFNTAVYQLGINLPASLFIIYYIQSLNASDGWLGINSSLGSAGVVVGYLIWERLLHRHQFIWSIRRATLLTWIFPVGIALVPSLVFIPLDNFLVNVLHPGFDLSSFNVMLKLTHPRYRTVSMSWYNTIVNISAFLGPIIGVWLAGIIDIRGALIVAGIVRIIGGLLFTLNRVVEPERGPEMS